MTPRPAGTHGASPITARTYDRQLWLERAALERALALAAPRRGERLLDVACGTGALLRRLAERADRPRVALGVDASAAMLARAARLPPGWTLVRGDARRLPMPDASVEVVTCAYLLHLLDAEDRRAALSEIRRVLAPGGRAVLVTLLMPRGMLGAGVLAPIQRGLCRALGAGSGWCAHDPLAELAAAGLRVSCAAVTTRGYASRVIRAERPAS